MTNEPLHRTRPLRFSCFQRRFRGIAADELVQRLSALRERLARECAPDAGASQAGRWCVALVGRPNAGKSTLFNALLGRERAIVSPILGTTRDVLTAELEVEGVPILLQDCAGLGDSEDALDLASYAATDRAAEQADLVLWVHPHLEPWRAN